MRSAVRVADRNPDKNQTGTTNEFKNANASRQKDRKEKAVKYCATRKRDDSGQKAGKVENAQKVIGKDEVGGSNPPSSSTETRCPARDSGFLLFLVSVWKSGCSNDFPTIPTIRTISRKFPPTLQSVLPSWDLLAAVAQQFVYLHLGMAVWANLKNRTVGKI